MLARRRSTPSFGARLRLGGVGVDLRRPRGRLGRAGQARRPRHSARGARRPAERDGRYAGASAEDRDPRSPADEAPSVGSGRVRPPRGRTSARDLGRRRLVRPAAAGRGGLGASTRKRASINLR